MRPVHILAFAALACASQDTAGPKPPLPPGTLKVAVTASGPLTPGPNYFWLYLDAQGPKLVWADSFLVWSDLPAGASTLRMDVLRPHCAASPDSQGIVIPSADTAQAAIAVTCWDGYGLVRVDLPATGSNLPSDLGIEVIGVVGTRAAANTAGLGFPLVPVGPQTVQLTDVPANCTVSDSNPQHVTVPLDSIVLRFAMSCS